MLKCKFCFQQIIVSASFCSHNNPAPWYIHSQDTEVNNQFLSCYATMYVNNSSNLYFPLLQNPSRQTNLHNWNLMVYVLILLADKRQFDSNMIMRNQGLIYEYIVGMSHLVFCGVGGQLGNLSGYLGEIPKDYLIISELILNFILESCKICQFEEYQVTESSFGLSWKIKLKQ